MPDGAKPTPGGWNGIQLQVSDIKAAAAHLRAEGVKFRRDDIVSEPGGSQIWVARPFGNLVEPFQPKQLKDALPKTRGEIIAGPPISGRSVSTTANMSQRNFTMSIRTMQ